MKQIKASLKTVLITALSLIPAASLAVTPIEPVPITPVSGTLDPIVLVTTIGGWMLGLAGALVVVYLIYGGIVYITGGPKAEESAKKIIMNSLIGLVVITIAYALSTFAVNLITSAIS